MADQRAIEFREKGKVLLEIPVLWEGWELDNKAWVIEYEGQVELVVTNHGGLCLSNEAMLREKLEEYAAAITATAPMPAITRERLENE